MRVPRTRVARVVSRALASRRTGFGRASLYAFDRPLDAHAHREAHLAFRVGGARVTMRVAGTDVALDDRTAAVVDARLPHDVRTSGRDGAALVLVLYFDGAPPALARAPIEGAVASARAALPLAPGTMEAVRRAAASMRPGAARGVPRGASGPAAPGPIGPESALDELVERVSSLPAAGRVPPRRAARTPIADPNARRLHAAVELMAGGFEVRRPLEEIAGEAGLSRPQLFRMFRERVGTTPNEYLDMLRADAAIERLARADGTATEIGLDLGFASQASFSRFFRQRVGVPPTALRRAGFRHVDGAYLRLSGIRRRAVRATLVM